MRKCILFSLVLLAFFALSCTASPSPISESSSAVSQFIANYNSYLHDKGRDVIQTYAMDEAPAFFGVADGWTAISHPSSMLLTQMSHEALMPECDDDTDCAFGENCTVTEDGTLCVSKSCTTDNDCPSGSKCQCGEWVDFGCGCEESGPSPGMPYGCPSDFGYTGINCTMAYTAGSFAECCGWCGCDDTGCQYDCDDSEDCPGAHSLWPYQYEP